MKRDLIDDNDYVVLSCRQEGVLCEFILKLGFTSGVTASGNYHFHSTYEMHVPVSGTLHIMVEDRDLLLSPSQVCVIPPDVIHYVYGDENAFRVGFRFAFSPVNKPDSDAYRRFLRAFGNSKDCLILPDCSIYSKYLSVAAQNIRKPLPDFMTAELLYLALYEAASLAVQAEISEDLPSNCASDVLLSERIEEYLNQNYTRELRLGELAAHLNLSSRQTERIILRLFSTPFTALVNKKRLTTAKLLLKITDLPVEEIARMSGFPDQNYFYRKFSAAYETTPGKYRKQVRTKAETSAKDPG